VRRWEHDRFRSVHRHGDIYVRQPPKASEIDERIAAVRENLRSLVEQAAAYSGAADDELTSRRIAAQEAQLEELIRQRDAQSQPKS
jgi:hypothetical protein